MSNDTGSESLSGATREVVIPQLVESVGSRLYRIGLRMCGNPDEAEDLVQEVFLQAWRKWDQFKGESQVTTWLYTIAAHACRRMHRRRAGEPDCFASFDELLPSNEPLMAIVPHESNDPEAITIRAEAMRHVQTAIADLPEEFRLPIIFKEILGLSIVETARVLDVKPETVKTRLHRARLRLRKALIEVLPHRDAPMPSYSIRVCLDLLEAKQTALDRGEPFPITEQTISERCQGVFDTLDLTQQACRTMLDGEMPAVVRERIVTSVCES